MDGPRRCALWIGATAVLGMIGAVMPATLAGAAPAGKDCFDEPATILGTRDADVLIGTAGRDVIVGWAGDDIILGMGGDDLICGGTGQDTIWGGSGNDLLAGDDGADLLVGSSGNDLADGGNGPDRLWGGSGDDRLYGQSGDDEVVGGAGDDELAGGPNRDSVWGGAGDDAVFGGPGDDELGGGTGANHVEGGDGDDELWSGPGPDTLVGGHGNDLLWGGGGTDQLYGGYGLDELTGGADDDLLVGGPDADVMKGKGGDDEVIGGDGEDELFGGAGDDRLFGGRGRDSIVGGGGNDLLSGGVDGDVLIGEGGRDVLVGGAGPDTLWAGDGDDSAFGGDGNDEVASGAGNDDVSGGRGNDSIYGGTGRDRLRGDEGNDEVNGGNDVDVVSGGPGRDTCEAGDAQDSCERTTGVSAAPVTSSATITATTTTRPAPSAPPATEPGDGGGSIAPLPPAPTSGKVANAWRLGTARKGSLAEQTTTFGPSYLRVVPKPWLNFNVDKRAPEKAAQIVENNIQISIDTFEAGWNHDESSEPLMIGTIPLSWFEGNAKGANASVSLAAMQAVADGEYDEVYDDIGRRIAKAGYGANTILRLGHEVNLPAFPWYNGVQDIEYVEKDPSTGKHRKVVRRVDRGPVYVAAYRRAHSLIRAHAPDVLFDYNLAHPGADYTIENPDAEDEGTRAWNPTGYPGDAYVDIIGMDIYCRSDGRMTEKSRSFMQAHLDLAKKHGKSVSFPEVGVTFPLNGASSHMVAGNDEICSRFLQMVFDFINDNDEVPVSYFTYWNSQKTSQGYRYQTYETTDNGIQILHPKTHDVIRSQFPSQR